MSAVDDIIFYDGTCGLCHGFVRFVLAADKRNVFVFAPLQGATAAAILARYGHVAAAAETLFLWQRLPEQPPTLWAGPDAVLQILRRLSTRWRLLAAAAALFPAPWTWAIYRLVARYRYRLFGRQPHCPWPDSRQRQKFLD